MKLRPLLFSPVPGSSVPASWAIPRLAGGGLRRSILSASFLLAFTATSQAGTLTWDGGSDTIWSTALNWAGDVAPVANDTLVFDGTSGLSNSNDLAASTAFAGITFNSTAGDFVLGGNSINLGGNLVVNKTSGTQTVNFDMALTGNRSANVASGGTLVLGGTVSGAFNLTKIGTGKLSLTGASNSYSGTTTVNGGILSLETTGAISSTPLTLGNGGFSMAGTAAAPRTQTVGALTLNSGRNVISLSADAAQPISLTAGSLAARAVGATTLFRGTGLGTAAPGTAGTSTIIFSTAPTPVTATTSAANNIFAATGNGNLGGTQAAVLRGSFVDTTATGNGSAFATYDAVNGVRALSSSEQATTYSSAVTGDNVLINLTGATSITGKQTNTLQVNNSTAGALTLTNSGTALLPTNGLLFTGSSAITLTGGTLTFNNTSAGGSDMVIYSSNTATVTLSTGLGNSGSSAKNFVFGGSGNFIVTGTNITSASSGGNYFNGPGTVELRTTAYGASSGGTIVNGGTLKLGTAFALSGSITRPISVAAGATFDINNISVASSATSGLDAINNINGLGGSVTNSGGTITNLKLSLQNGAGDFSGTVSGNINLILNKQGTTTNRIQKFTGALTYAGITGVTSANATGETTAFLTIGAGGSLPSGTAVTLGGVINGTGVAGGNGVLTLGDGNGPVNQTVASLASGGTGTSNAVIGGATTVSTLTMSGSINTTFAGTIGGAGANNNNLALVRGGSGNLTLTGTNTYTGATTISGGTLTLGATGAIDNTSGVSLGSGGTFDVSAKSGYTVNNLTGAGNVVGALTVSTSLAIGNSQGTTTFGGDLTLGTSAVSSFEFTNPSFTVGSYDLALGGTGTQTVDFGGGTLNLIFSGGTYAVNSTVQIFTFENYTGNFGTVNITGLNIDQTASFDSLTGAVTITAVPEPGAAMLGCLGVLALLRRHR